MSAYKLKTSISIWNLSMTPEVNLMSFTAQIDDLHDNLKALVDLLSNAGVCDKTFSSVAALLEPARAMAEALVIAAPYCVIRGTCPAGGAV